MQLSQIGLYKLHVTENKMR